MLNRARSCRLPDFPLAWERLLWSGRPTWLARLVRFEEYHLTDFRALVRRGNRTVAELAIHDLERVELRETRWQRRRGTSTIVLHAKKRQPAKSRGDAAGTPAPRWGASVVFADIRQGPQLALILELLATDAVGLEADGSLVREALGPDARRLFRPRPRVLAAWAATIVLLVALSAVIVARHDIPIPIAYPADDAIYPGGHLRARAEIVAFMEHEVMPFARRVLGPIKGGPEQVTCFTCHGAEAEARDWRMPAVRALPEPDLRMGGMEHFASIVDAQMRNAVYGYLAEDQKQDRAAYMRGVVMPGMARLLHRPPYDFTQTYRYNRARFAFGCYHCHMVSAPEQPGSRYAPASTQTSPR
jgi:hypothetical protein